jgi:hypothetical protein
MLIDINMITSAKLQELGILPDGMILREQDLLRQMIIETHQILMGQLNHEQNSEPTEEGTNQEESGQSAGGAE